MLALVGNRIDLQLDAFETFQIDRRPLGHRRSRTPGQRDAFKFVRGIDRGEIAEGNAGCKNCQRNMESLIHPVYSLVSELHVRCELAASCVLREKQDRGPRHSRYSRYSRHSRVFRTPDLRTSSSRRHLRAGRGACVCARQVLLQKPSFAPLPRTTLSSPPRRRSCPRPQRLRTRARTAPRFWT